MASRLQHSHRGRAGSPAWRLAHHGAQLVVEGGQACAILLLEHQVRNRRGGALGILELGHRRGVALIGHALAGVQDQVCVPLLHN